MADGDAEHQAQLIHALKAEVAHLVEQHACLQYFCNEHTYVRYLRARSWDLKKAAKMLMHTLEWRLTYKPHEIKWDNVHLEAALGKLQVYPVPDKEGRPVILMRPRLRDPATIPEDQIMLLVYHLELASRMADASGVGKMTWLIDFEGYSRSASPPMAVSMLTLHTLQNHYPERLGSAVCFHAPMLFSLLYKAVGPFIDPVTKHKVGMVNKGASEKADMEKRFDMSQLESCMGGTLVGTAFDLEKYAARMLAMEAEVHAAMQAITVQMKVAAAAGTTEAGEEVAAQNVVLAA